MTLSVPANCFAETVAPRAVVALALALVFGVGFWFWLGCGRRMGRGLGMVRRMSSLYPPPQTNVAAGVLGVGEGGGWGGGGEFFLFIPPPKQMLVGGFWGGGGGGGGYKNGNTVCMLHPKHHQAAHGFCTRHKATHVVQLGGRLW